MQTRMPQWMRSTKGTPFLGIGSLEADVLALVWEKKQASVRDIYEALRKRRRIAYTTVMTIMNNLVKKGLLAQDRSNIAFVYRPAIPADDVVQTIIDAIVQRLLGGRSNLALSHLLGLSRTLTSEEVAKLRRHADKDLGSGDGDRLAA